MLKHTYTEPPGVYTLTPREAATVTSEIPWGKTKSKCSVVVNCKQADSMNGLGAKPEPRLPGLAPMVPMAPSVLYGETYSF